MDTLYCITHEQMEIVNSGELTGQPVHLVVLGDIRDPDIDWCEGPFASCPPPETGDGYWDAVFANEEADDEYGWQELEDWER